MRVRLLGPLDVTVDGTVRPVSGLRRKGLLAMLSLEAGRIVSTDRLAHAIWNGRPPATLHNTIQSHVSYLRRVFGVRDAIVARPPGYVLQLGAEATDIAVAERLLRQARQSTDWAANASRLRAALALWRGPALVDVGGLSWLEEHAQRLTQLQADTRHALIEARLALGEHAELVPELQRITAEQPYHEKAHGRLMLALYRTGRPADALEAYQRLRHSLHHDLGLEPSPALRQLQAAILQHDRELAQPAAVEVVSAAPAFTVPRQLPLAAHTFSGREAELAYLDALLDDASAKGADRPGAMVVAALSGSAGIGKTALALHWAHRVATRFPDGQLHVNLRGLDTDGPILDPAVALRSFLDALGVPAGRIPSGLDDKIRLYRSTLWDKRVLVVLDDARDAAQVRPLLPGSTGCAVVVTSRDPLIGLVAREGAAPLTLYPLTRDQARWLLARRLGKERIEAEPYAVDDIIDRCARLPFALAVAAAHAATRPDIPLATVAAELGTARSGREITNGKAVFPWSHRASSTGAAASVPRSGLAQWVCPAPGSRSP